MPKRMKMFRNWATIGIVRCRPHRIIPTAEPIHMQPQKQKITPRGSAGAASPKMTTTPMHSTKNTTELVAQSRMIVASTRSSWVICGNISSGSVLAAAFITLL